MLAYEFYSRGEFDSYHLIGILPERRTRQERVTEESIMKWVRMVLGDDADVSDIFFVKVTIDESGAERRKDRD